MGEKTGLLLPEGALLLHIGPYKTGTTAIQRALHDARPTLLEHGVLYPGRSRRQRREGWAVLRRHPLGRRKPEMREWEALVDKVNAFEGERVVISTEDFGSAGPSQIARITNDLGAERVHVVVTARRLDRLLPSQWQERIKSHDTHSFDAWLRRVLSGDEGDREWKRFWASHDLTRTYRRWEPVVGNDRFTLIAADESNRRLLHGTFEEMLGLPVGALKDSSENTSLSANSIELLRQVNEAFLEQGWPDDAYFRVIQRGVLPRIVGLKHELDERIPPLPGWAQERVAALSEQREKFFVDMGVHIVGDLASLRTEPPRPGEDPQPPRMLPIDVAALALQGAVDGAMALRDQSLKDAAGATGPNAQHAPRLHGHSVEETSARELIRVVARRAARRIKPGR